MSGKEHFRTTYVRPIVVSVSAAIIIAIGSAIVAKLRGIRDWRLLIVIALLIIVSLLLIMVIFFAAKIIRFNRVGLLGVYKNRAEAFKDFGEYMKKDEHEIIVIARCMYGLLISGDIKDALEHILENKSNKITFLLTHPGYADISVGPHGDGNPCHYASLVYDALSQLSEWNVPSENVRLYKGSPTIFAIKTANYMLITPYPYGANAHNSPSLIVQRVSGQSGLYDCYADTHFSVLVGHNPCVCPISDYDSEIQKHKSLETTYGRLARNLYNADLPTTAQKK